ncbi:hypothetical protein [Parvibaculum sp.]|jgi:hypothetical protein|uniref:hypothetical protein n=1 Tax=Parvibaculum sp. TaxID=2024848 RepID=UPI002FD8F738
MTLTRWLSCLCLAAALGGCATRAPDLAPLVQIAPKSCTAAPDVTRAHALPFDTEDKAEPVRLTIEEQSPCLDEGGVKSLYEVFALPELSYPIIVTVRSLPSTSGILAPRIVLLDKDGGMLRELDREAVHFRGTALTAMLRTRPEERYLVVASDPDVVGSDISRVHGAVNQQMVSTGAVMFTVYTGSESTANMTYAHNGTIQVSARAIPTAQ